MKKLLFAAAALATLSACSGNKQAQQESELITPAQSLIDRLDRIQQAGLVAFGHHDDPVYGVNWEYLPDTSDIKAITGDYPAIINWDLGHIELDSARELDGVPFDLIRSEVLKQHYRGGINSFSWHPRNPVSGGDAWDNKADSVMLKAVTPGYAENDTMKVWIGRAADFIASLRDSSDRLVPVIFRPWHEHTGDWFWWGNAHSTPGQYKALWVMTREIFDSKGLDNVVWAYSPDKTGCQSIDEYLAKYPGDEYVDILGADVYYSEADGKDAFIQKIHNILEPATILARQRGKLVALTETGSEGVRPDNWYTDILLTATKDYPLAYITAWRNSHIIPGHFYVPFPGHPAAPDFMEFYKKPETGFASDIARIPYKN